MNIQKTKSNRLVNSNRFDWDGALGSFFNAISIPLFLAIALFPIYRGYFWLKNGYALTFTSRDFLSSIGVTDATPNTSWFGLNKLLLWLLDAPVEAAAVAAILTMPVLYLACVIALFAIGKGPAANYR